MVFFIVICFNFASINLELMRSPKLTLFSLVFTVAFSFAQVGINTTDPQRDLDVNGGLRIRSASDVNADTTYDRVLLMDSDGANTEGNVDYNSIDDFRSKIIDFSKLTVTEINDIKEYLGLPQCTKGALPADNSAHPVTISFASGYEFRYYNDTFVSQIEVRKTGAAVEAQASEIGGDIASADAPLSVDNTWRRILRVSAGNNDVGTGLLIIHGTAETFKFEVAHKRFSGSTVFSMCVSQTVL